VTVSLFGWYLVFGTKQIPFLPSPEKFSLTRFGQNSDDIYAYSHTDWRKLHLFMFCSKHIIIENNSGESLFTNMFTKLSLRCTYSEFYM